MENSQVSNFWDFLVALSWPVGLLFVLCILNDDIKRIAKAFAFQLEKATELKLFGGLELKGPRVDPGPIEIPGNDVVRTRADPQKYQDRNLLYNNTRHLMLVHRIRPSTVLGQEFDISVFLVRKTRRGYDTAEFHDVKFVEYYFGEYFGKKPHGDIYRVSKPENGFAMTTSAYGGALCVATIFFTDGQTAKASRFLDFEMSGAFGRNKKAK